jgi:hypothetical protein
LPNWNTVLERAGQWFLHSGIQEPGGGVARYYRSDLRANARVSTEITGYAISFLVYAHQRTGSAELLDCALRSALFLKNHAWDARLGLFPFEHSSNGHQPKLLAYFFDSGIIVRGLLAIWRVTENADFLDLAIATGRGMLSNFGSGSVIPPILTLPDRHAQPYESKWSAAPGCYQLKSAMAWHDLFLETGDPVFERPYQSALGQALDDHDRFLPGDVNPERVMDRLHAYLYFLEGMQPCAKRSDCSAALRTGIERVAGYLRAIAPAFVRSDVYAQLLRVRLFAGEAGVVPLDSTAAAHEAQHAAAFQFDSKGPRFDGGFGFGAKNEEMMPFVNPVSTAFCAQALDLWQQQTVPSLTALV